MVMDKKSAQMTLNGSTVDIPIGETIDQLLAKHHLTGKRLAIELNGHILPKSLYTGTLLAEGDQIEIVIAVGGG